MSGHPRKNPKGRLGVRDAAHLRSVAHYDPQTGHFTWVNVASHRLSSIKEGQRAGYLQGNSGYWRLGVGGKRYAAHRLAWLYVHGEWPVGEIDHINGIRTDNRIANLRQASRAENGRNLGKHSTNTSGYRGVTWDRFRRRWKAQIKFNQKNICLGRYESAEAAHDARMKKERELFGPFMRGAA